MKTKKKLGLKIILGALAILLAVILAYVAYVFIDYHRIEDMQPLTVGGESGQIAELGTEYTIVSWNIGFGAYESDFGFFMDGGSESRAFSEERLTKNMAEICSRLTEQGADFYLVQEVDFDSTRSYHLDETAMLVDAMSGYSSVFAQNYDSPYLMYPLTKPHGASKSGLLTFSSFGISSALRRSLPIENGFMKLLDLDRCYSVSRIPLDCGGELVLYNLHLSAYTSDGTIATEQLSMLLDDMQAEYERGNRCIAGGDFNKDVLGNSASYFTDSEVEYTWAQPIPDEMFAGKNISLVKPIDEVSPVPSCRNADGPYHVGQYVVTVDGFLVSDNVDVTDCDVIDFSFEYSDHNPVRMTFSLR